MKHTALLQELQEEFIFVFMSSDSQTSFLPVDLCKTSSFKIWTACEDVLLYAGHLTNI